MNDAKVVFDGKTKIMYLLEMGRAQVKGKEGEWEDEREMFVRNGFH